MANGEHRPTRTSRAVAHLPSAEGALSGDEHDSTETSSAVVGSAATRHHNDPRHANGRIGETLRPSNVSVNAVGALDYDLGTGVIAHSRSTPGYLAGPRRCGFGATVLRSTNLILTHSRNDCK